MHSGKPAIVKQLPERLVKGELEPFCRDFAALLRAERPRLVLDFSRVQEIDRFGAETLLAWLKHALKANGDIKLAALAGAPELILELTGVGRVFEAYPTVFEAVQSFHGYPNDARPVDEFWPAAEEHAGYGLRIAN